MSGWISATLDNSENSIWWDFRPYWKARLLHKIKYFWLNSEKHHSIGDLFEDFLFKFFCGSIKSCFTNKSATFCYLLGVSCCNQIFWVESRNEQLIEVLLHKQNIDWIGQQKNAEELLFKINCLPRGGVQQHLTYQIVSWLVCPKNIDHMIFPLQSGSVFYARAKLTGAQYKHIVLFTVGVLKTTTHVGWETRFNVITFLYWQVKCNWRKYYYLCIM